MRARTDANQASPSPKFVSAKMRGYYLSVGLVILQLAVVVIVQGFHTPFEELIKYPHCWPLDADDDNDEPISCDGLDMVWNEFPESIFIEEGDTFALSINITAAPLFLSGGLCSNPHCDSDCSNVEPTEDCCVLNATVIVCYPDPTHRERPPVCVPWVKKTAETTYQTEPQCGELNRTYNDTLTLEEPGVNAIIYQLRVRERLIVLGNYLILNPTECGDGNCQPLETCNECPAEGRRKCVICPEDCCPLAVEIILGVFFGGCITILIVITVSITLIVSLCLMRRHRKRMRDESWIIYYNDIIINTGKKAKSSLVSLNKRKTDNISDRYSSTLQLQAQQIFTEIGTYNGRTVAIKRVHKTRSLFGGTIPSKLRKEVIKIRGLEHQNLCKFIGATVKDPPPNITIISEYCSKGSLNDVLLNDDVPLNWNFRFSFAGDIARGMAFLHSHCITHGRLTSSNCVIDDRWTTKITDYGLRGLRHCDDTDDETDNGQHMPRNIPKVYRAPEDRDLSLDQPSTTAPADVYSYAIMLYEIATRTDPRSEDMWQLDANFKPKINQKQLNEVECPCSQDYLHLINRCWTFSPQTRHTFDKIKKQLREINPSNTSAIDNMMHMMEKYSKHLEQLVEERTSELESEKERATILLYRMIPPAVAEELKNGKTIGAETFEGATIFFSDIIGFTNLAGSSTPMQIVNLLNKLYTEFDEILDQFDVYKVETIGDAYMVVSGVPKVNGDNHAGEIAKMALKLMTLCMSFTIPHKPDTKLQIRAGIHSGSVCAGVVGVKMPRYCLFGDTVNTASRMESNSLAMHIQCSSATYELLNKLGGFTLGDRGIIDVKGKGPMNTWWLTDYKEPDIIILPPTREDAPNSPTTKEPIREAPKKMSSVGDRSSPDIRCSTGNISQGMMELSTGMDLFKKHQSLRTSSVNNLLAMEGSGDKGNDKMIVPKRSITMPREGTSLGSGSASELPQMKTSQSTTKTHGQQTTRYSVPHIKVNTFPTGTRRVTQPNIESVGLAPAPSGLHRKTSRTTNRDITTQVAVVPLDTNQDTTL